MVGIQVGRSLRGAADGAPQFQDQEAEIQVQSFVAVFAGRAEFEAHVAQDLGTLGDLADIDGAVEDNVVRQEEFLVAFLEVEVNEVVNVWLFIGKIFVRDTCLVYDETVFAHRNELSIYREESG